MRVTELCMLVLSTTVLAFPGHAQGHIYGVITNSASSELLVGANLFLLGTAFGCSTILEGQFSIVRVGQGDYLLRVSYMGSEVKTIPIQIRTGQSHRVDGALAVEVLRGQAIVVIAQAVGQAAAINQPLPANTIVNVVSEEKIQKFPDANTVKAVGRLLGMCIRRSVGRPTRSYSMA